MAQTSIRKILRDGRTGEVNALDLDTLYNMFCDSLFQKVTTIFKWNGLPFPQHELERILCTYGYGTIVKDAKVGIMCSNCSMSGQTQYPDIFQNITYSQATAQGGTFTIGKDCILAKNNSIYQSMMPLIEMYASLLAHARISLKCATINARFHDILVADTDETRNNVNEWYSGLYKGNLASILDETITMDSNLMNIGNTGKNVDLRAYCDLESEIMRAFYREFGIRWVRDKRSNMLEAEIVEDGQLLMFNVHDMYERRKETAADYNKVFAGSVSVEFSEPFKIIMERGDFSDDSDRIHDSAKEEAEVS